MTDNDIREEQNISSFLEEHCGQAAIDPDFRRSLAARTRMMVKSRTNRSPRWRRAPLWACTGTVAVALIASLCFMHHGRQNSGSERLAGIRPIESVQNSELVAVTSIQGAVTLASGRPLKLGDRIGVGSAVQTGENAQVTLITHRGSLLHLGSKSELRIKSSNRAAIHHGRLYCSNRMHEIQRIDTPAGQIQLLGTVIDASVLRPDTAAVTVLEGQVRLSNSHGETLLDFGKRAVMAASTPPEVGVSVDTCAVTAWYDGRNKIVSDSGEIVYLVSRKEMDDPSAPSDVTEVWAMKTNGTAKHRITSCLIYSAMLGDWLPGSPYIVLMGDPHFFPPTRQAVEQPQIGTIRLLNVKTGQIAELEFPKRLDAADFSVSPDGRQLAFAGRYWESVQQSKDGIWLYDIQTGRIGNIIEGWLSRRLTWSADSRHLVASEGRQLRVVDTQTGRVTKLEIDGMSPSLSPDGTKLAYCADFKNEGSHFHRVPASGSIFVVDLKPGSKPRRVSPEAEGSLEPHWSPDGTRILYHTMEFRPWNEPQAYSLFVVNADGSDRIQIYRGKGQLEATAWAPNGKTVYARTHHNMPDAGVVAVAADGSGKALNLGGNSEDSILASAEKSQSRQAWASIREARTHFHAATQEVRDGRQEDSQEEFKTATRLLAELPWRYPLAGLSTWDTQTATEACESWASLSAQKPSAQKRPTKARQ